MIIGVGGVKVDIDIYYLLELALFCHSMQPLPELCLLSNFRSLVDRIAIT